MFLCRDDVLDKFLSIWLPLRIDYAQEFEIAIANVFNFLNALRRNIDGVPRTHSLSFIINIHQSLTLEDIVYL
jgi:formate/nitrite transporter FocA (FNT family)